MTNTENSETVWPPEMPRSTDWGVLLDERPLHVHRGPRVDYVILCADDVVTLTLVHGVFLHPNPLKITPQNRIRLNPPGLHRQTLQAQPGASFVVQSDKCRELWVFVVPGPVLPEKMEIRELESGKIHQLNEIHLEDNQCLHLPEGAVLRGSVRAIRKQNVRIIGAGIIDAGYGGQHGDRMSVVFDHCQDVQIQGITCIDALYPNLVLGCCSRAEVSDVHLISERVSTDGIQIYGGKQVHIKDCALITHDDCIVLKAGQWDYNPGGGIWNWREDIQEIIVEGCTLFNTGGNAIEVGHETACDHICDVTFKDCDVVEKQGMGAVFGIAVADRAQVSRIRYENIRVHHYFDKLFAFRCIPDGAFSDQGQGGNFSDILIKDLSLHQKVFNKSYSVSIIGGLSQENPARNIHFQNIRINGKPIHSLDSLHLFTRNTENVTIA